MNQHIGKEIRKLRLTLGLSQTQLAGKEMTRSYISLIENGSATPSKNILKIIAHRLGKPLEYFLLTHPEQIDTDIAHSLYEFAQTKISQGAKESGLQLLNKALTHAQDPILRFQIHEVKARLAEEHGEKDAALSEYRLALTLLLGTGENKKMVNTLLKIAAIYFYREEFEQAKQCYEQALQYSQGLKKLQKERTDIYMFLGTTFIRLGKIEQSISMYKEALKECEWINDRRRFGKIAMGLGKAYYFSDHLTESIKWTNQAAEAFPPGSKEHVFALHNVSVLELQTGFLSQSYQKMKKCLDFYREHQDYSKQALILETIAEYWIKNGDLEQAKKICREGLHILEKVTNHSISANFYRLLGIIHLHSDEREHAYFFVRMSYDLFIRLRAAREAEKSLSLLHQLEQEA